MTDVILASERVRTDEDEDEDEGDLRMDTDQDTVGEDAACVPQEVAEESSELDIAILQQTGQTHTVEEESNPETEPAVLDVDGAGDQMECDDSESAPMFIDDDSSSRAAFPESASDLPGGSPTAVHPLPECSRRNKRKNFKPRNIVYTYTDSEDNEGVSDAESRSQLAPSEGQLDSSSTDLPLDLSETPTLRRSLLPRRLDGAVDLSRGPTPSDGCTSSPSAHPRLNALLARPTSPCLPDESSGAGGSSDPPDMKEYAELTMRRILGLYGLTDLSDNPGIPPALLYSGRCSLTLSLSPVYNWM